MSLTAFCVHFDSFLLHTFVHVALTSRRVTSYCVFQKAKTSWCIKTLGLSSTPCYIIYIRDTLGRLYSKKIKNDKCVHSWLILTFDSAQPESNSVILQIGEGEPASLHVSNIDPSGKANNNGQILWFRGLNRIQQQVIR